jgi:hypothetical protein
LLRVLRGLGGRRRQDDQARPGRAGQADEVGNRHVGTEVVYPPAVFAQAGRRHERGQRVMLARRGRRHGGAARAAARLLGPGGDEPFADRARPMLDRHRHGARRPVVPDPAQGRRDDQVAQVEQRDAGDEPGEQVPCALVIAGYQGLVQAFDLRCPVPYPDLAARLRAAGPQFGQGADVALADLVAARGLASGQGSFPDPPVGGLVMHPEGLSRVS